MKIAQQFYFSEDNLWHFYHYIKLRYLQYFQGFWFNWEVGYSKKSFLNLWSIHFQNYIFIFIYLNHSNLRGGGEWQMPFKYQYFWKTLWKLALNLYVYSKTAKKSGKNDKKPSHLHLDIGMQIHSMKSNQNLQKYKSLFKKEPLWTQKTWDWEQIFVLISVNLWVFLLLFCCGLLLCFVLF